MTKQQEIEIVQQLTNATDGQIKINEVGWTSRVYIVSDGQFVFKFPRSKFAREELKHEINMLKLVKNHDFNLQTQTVMWEGENCEYVGLAGVIGEALTPEIVGRLDVKQKEMLGQQLGTFLKKLHSIKGYENPNGTEQDQIDEYQEKYCKNKGVFEQYFDASEMTFIDELFLVTAPNQIKELGNDLVFCHGDFGYNNILIDSNLTAGVIDFGDAGLNDRSVDFVDLDDGNILNAALKAYGDNEILRQKIALRQMTFPIYLMLFYIDRKELDGIKKCVDKIRLVLDKNSV